MATHPKLGNARVLLSSVFGPYAQDDEFGSCSINPRELYHNQVTRAQGSFSLRMSHRFWGIMMIQANISAPCTVLDFPTRKAFTRELSTNHYDVVGISSIIVNLGKVRRNVPHGSRAIATFGNRCRRTRGGHSRPGNADRPDYFEWGVDDDLLLGSKRRSQSFPQNH